MIIKSQSDVTAAVLAELDRAADPRFKEIMSAAVRHLHEFAREVKLTESEFQQACAHHRDARQADRASRTTKWC